MLVSYILILSSQNKPSNQGSTRHILIEIGTTYTLVFQIVQDHVALNYILRDDVRNNSYKYFLFLHNDVTTLDNVHNSSTKYCNVL